MTTVTAGTMRRAGARPGRAPGPAVRRGTPRSLSRVSSASGFVLAGWGAELAGCGTVLAGWGAELAGCGTVLAGWGAELAGCGTVLAGWGAELAGCGTVSAGCAAVSAGWGGVWRPVSGSADGLPRLTDAAMDRRAGFGSADRPAVPVTAAGRLSPGTPSDARSGTRRIHAGPTRRPADSSSQDGARSQFVDGAARQSRKDSGNRTARARPARLPRHPSWPTRRVRWPARF
jgi:hypothetical protein